MSPNISHSDKGSSCPDCGKSYQSHEFWFDAIGRTQLDHRCERAAIVRFRKRHERAKGFKPIEFICCDCLEIHQGTDRSERCHKCSAIRRQKQDALRHARLANLLKAQQAPRCSDCKRAAKPGLTRCAYHERKALARLRPTWAA